MKGLLYWNSSQGQSFFVKSRREWCCQFLRLRQYKALCFISGLERFLNSCELSVVYVLISFHADL